MFGDVIQNLERSKTLLVQSASVSHFQEAQEARILFCKHFEAQRESEEQHRHRTVIDWLSHVSFDTFHDELRDTRKKYPGTTQWIFDSAPFRGWFQSNDNASPLFWLCGIPGAGNMNILYCFQNGVLIV